MIDLRYSMQAFDEYRKSYANTEKINLKVAHMKRVMRNNIQLAQDLHLPLEDVSLAGLIGLLHDIGRFEQIKRYDTFIDSESIDHAMFSSEQLFDEGLIRKFIKDDEYDSIIRAAIENHSRFEIASDGLSDRAILHSKLIRDSDKTDIYVQVMGSDAQAVFVGTHSSTDRISEKVFRDFMDRKCIKNQDLRCKADDYVRKVALIYGLYFPQSLHIVANQDLINRLTEFFKSSFEFSDPVTTQYIDIVNNSANNYIRKKINQLEIGEQKKSIDD